MRLELPPVEQILDALSMYPIVDRHYLPSSRSNYYSCAFVVDDQVVEMELHARKADENFIRILVDGHFCDNWNTATPLGWLIACVESNFCE